MLRNARFALLAGAATAKLVSIRNDLPRLDTTGAIMDAHDMSLRLLPDGRYVMHAIEYGLCVAPAGKGCDQTPDHCGFRDTHNVTVWTSPDLTSGSWTREGYAFPLAARPAGLIFRPDAIFNPNTGLWVLYYNQASPGNVYMSCTSSSPFGPFTGFAQTNVTDDVWTGGDFHLFNDGAQGYVIWTGMSKPPGNDHKIRISKLTSDWLGVTDDPPYTFNDNAPTTTFNEAPSIFLRNGVWYALFGHCVRLRRALRPGLFTPLNSPSPSIPRSAATASRARASLCTRRPPRWGRGRRRARRTTSRARRPRPRTRSARAASRRPVRAACTAAAAT
jgi:hypothetical protein